VPVSGAAGADQALELHRGDDVLEAGIAVLVHLGRVVDIEAGGNDDCPNVTGHDLALVVVIDGFLFTYVLAFATGDGVNTEAVFHVEDVGTRHRLRKRDVDRLTR